MRTPIGAISISPDSNLGSLERGECARISRCILPVEHIGKRRLKGAMKKGEEAMVSRDALLAQKGEREREKKAREKGRKEGIEGDDRRMESKW